MKHIRSRLIDGLPNDSELRFSHTVITVFSVSDSESGAAGAREQWEAEQCRAAGHRETAAHGETGERRLQSEHMMSFIPTETSLIFPCVAGREDFEFNYLPVYLLAWSLLFSLSKKKTYQAQDGCLSWKLHSNGSSEYLKQRYVIRENSVFSSSASCSCMNSNSCNLFLFLHLFTTQRNKKYSVLLFKVWHLYV